MRHAPLARIGLCFALLGAAGPAHAAADLTSVTFTVSVVHVENAVKSVTASVEVVGDRITRASITPPRGTAVEIPAGGAGFLLEQTFTTEADLTKAFPDGTYVLTLNGTTDYELDVARAPVPSPAISAPLPAEVLVPGPVTVEFTRCSICDQEGDATTGLLLEQVAKLAESMTSSTIGTVGVVDASLLPLATPVEVRIGSERLLVSRLDDTHITVIDRGVAGTTAAAHTANDAVSEVIASDDTLTGSATALVDSMTAATLGTAEVEDARVFPSDHAFEVSIGSERLNISRLDDTHITVIKRGVGDTDPAEHAANDRVSEVGQSDTMWTPAASLDADTSFTAAIVHSVLRADSLVGPGNDEFDLVGSFSDEDSVSFFSGAALPAGTICVVVDDDSLDTGSCFVVEHPVEESGALLDPSGTFPLPIGGIDMQYTSEVRPSGEIVGTAVADLDGNGSLESTTPVGGKVTGSAGKVQRNLGFAFKTVSPAAKLKVKIDESGFVTDGFLAGKQTAKGTVEGVKIKESAPSTLALGEEPLGWRLDVELAGKQVDVASVRLSDGREFALTGRYVFDFLTGLGKLDLESSGTDAGVSVRIEELAIDDSTDPPVMTDGVLIYKILGQRGRFPRAR